MLLCLCPRDYLSTFLKITTVLVLGPRDPDSPAAAPDAGTGRRSRTGGEGARVCGQSCFPFAFITIACGAIFRFPLARRVGHDAEDDQPRNRPRA